MLCRRVRCHVVLCHRGGHQCSCCVVVSGAMSSTATMKYVCGDCARVFNTKQQLLVHQYIHKEKPNTTCTVCGKTLANEAAFRRHRRMHDRDAAASGGGDRRKRRVCAQCSVSFESRAALEDHHRREHLHNKLFGCDVCDAVFSWPANLARHRRSHVKTPEEEAAAALAATAKPELPYVCQVCKKGFKFDFSYEAHLNSHAVTQQLDVGGSETRELIVEILNVPGEPMASTVTIDTGGFTAVKSKPDAGKTAAAAAAGAGAAVVERQAVQGEASESEARAAHGSGEKKVPLKPVVLVDDEDVRFAADGKPLRRRRNPEPLIYDFTMTPEKRFVCEVCDMPFRWQISLYVHMREHFGMEPGLEVVPTRGRVPRRARGRGRPRGRGAAASEGRRKRAVPHSKIVKRHASSDEEEEFTVGEYVVRRRGKGRFTTIKAPAAAGADTAGKKRRAAPPNEQWVKVEGAPPPAGQGAVKVEGVKRARLTSPRVARRRRVVGSAADLFAVWAAPVVAAHMQWQRRRQHDRRAFACRMCARALPTRALRDAHRLRHAPRRQCGRCKRCFANACSAAIHRLSHAAPLAPHRCPLCAKQFGKPTALEAHVRAHAAAFAARACTACTRRFATPDALRAHVADCTANATPTTHTCDVCHKVFTRKRFFEMHRRSGCIFGAFDDDAM